MTLGDYVKKYRLDHSLSMDDFATLSGLSKGYISMLEKNKNPRNDKPIVPSIVTFKKVSSAINVSLDELMRLVDGNQPVYLGDDTTDFSSTPTPRKGIRIPVLGRVIAGIPHEAITDILDYEEIDSELAKTGEFFALQVKGSSMEPKLYEGDVVIVKKQPTIESGETAIILVNGDEATIKQVKSMDSGIMLIGHNTAVYEPHFYSREDIATLPVQIIGKVIELRRKF